MKKIIQIIFIIVILIIIITVGFNLFNKKTSSLESNSQYNSGIIIGRCSNGCSNDYNACISRCQGQTSGNVGLIAKKLKLNVEVVV